MWKWMATLEQRWVRGEGSNWQKLLSSAAVVIALSGSVGSVCQFFRADQRNESLVLWGLFAIWVLSPFLALLIVARISKRWSVPKRAALVAFTLGLTAYALAIYGNVASSPADSRVAFPFIVVPLASWLLMATVIPIGALLSRRLSRFWLVRWTIRAIAGVVMAAVLGVAALLGLLLFDHNRDTILPAPTGPFAVGRTTFVWADAEADPLGPPGAKRELLAWIWYPAAPGQLPEPANDYLPAAWRAAMENQSGVLLSQFLTRDLSRVQPHSFGDVPVSPQQPAYPVVLMRAGGAALTTDYTTLAEDLASHGYVVAGFDAPYRSWVVVLPDGRIIPRASHNNLDNVDGPEADKRAETLARAWTVDASFVLDQLLRLNTSDPSGRFQGRLDLQRVGMFGHSLGGATALLFCHDDSRCKAGIDVDGAPLGRVIAKGVTQPFMFLLSDHSREPVTSESPESIRNAMANIRAICNRSPSDRRMIVGIRGANHYLFSDNAGMLKSPLAMRVLRMLGIVQLDGRRQIAVTAHAICTFFDVYLKGAPASALKSRLECPEIEFIR
jgi:predicted dienelactone hydrolase